MSAVADMRWGPMVPKLESLGYGSRLRGDDSRYCGPRLARMRARERLPEGSLDRGALRQPVTPEHVGDGLHIAVVDVLTPVRDHVIRFRRASASSHSSLASLE